jgi:hypothetical protein
MTSINLVHVSALEYPSYGVFQIKGIRTQHANLGVHRPHWND